MHFNPEQQVKITKICSVVLATWQVPVDETSKAGDAIPEDDPLKIQFYTKDIGTLISLVSHIIALLK